VRGRPNLVASSEIDIMPDHVALLGDSVFDNGCAPTRRTSPIPIEPSGRDGRKIAAAVAAVIRRGG
jgi:hypothetical protein